MKKYNHIIIGSVCLYLLLAVLSGIWMTGQKTEQNRFYKVEINRIYEFVEEQLALNQYRYENRNLSDGCLTAVWNDLQKSDEWIRLVDSCQWVKRVDCSSIIENQERITDFYTENKTGGIEIRPVFLADRLQGFLRFDYVQEEFDNGRLFWTVQISLGLMVLLSLTILFYLKYKLLRPFERMKSLPYEMAQGHLKGMVKEEKNRFFGQFFWGISQLKDSLDISRKRTLELEKEKKLLLLSLSHDIKTPLNCIKLYTKALQEDLYQEKSKHMFVLGQICEKTSEIEQYVEEIIKNSREEILDLQVRHQEFYLKELMKRVLQTYEEACAVRMIELSIGFYENRLLEGDIDRTFEVFENIFENAFKYGDGRKIAVTFYEEEDCQLVRIFNSGEPVTENELNHIFESFFRAANSRGKPGNGLGLYICREIMQKMGGAVFAEREENGMAIVLVFE